MGRRRQPLDPRRLKIAAVSLCIPGISAGSTLPASLASRPECAVISRWRPEMRSLRTKQGWRVPALLGVLCLLAPAGLAVPALFMFLLFVLMVLGEAA